MVSEKENNRSKKYEKQGKGFFGQNSQNGQNRDTDHTDHSDRFFLWPVFFSLGVNKIMDLQRRFYRSKQFGKLQSYQLILLQNKGNSSLFSIKISCKPCNVMEVSQ